MKINNSMKTKLIYGVLLCVFLLPTILAFAVSSQYYENNPLYMQPWETTETFFTLQNIAGTKNVTLRAEITYGKEILKLVDNNETYKVPLGEKVKVNFKISTPADAKIGDKFPITLTFTTITSSQEPIAIGSSIGKGFEVIIGQPSDFREVPKEKTKISTIIYILIGIIILIVIIFLLQKRKKKSTKKIKAFW